jgi:hypothetical protein
MTPFPRRSDDVRPLSLEAHELLIGLGRVEPPAGAKTRLLAAYERGGAVVLSPYAGLWGSLRVGGLSAAVAAGACFVAFSAWPSASAPSSDPLVTMEARRPLPASLAVARVVDDPGLAMLGGGPLAALSEGTDGP